MEVPSNLPTMNTTGHALAKNVPSSPKLGDYLSQLVDIVKASVA